MSTHNNFVVTYLETDLTIRYLTWQNCRVMQSNQLKFEPVKIYEPIFPLVKISNIKRIEVIVLAYVKKQGDKYKIVVSNGTDSNGKKIREITTFTPDPNMTAKQQEKALEVFVFEFEQKFKNGLILKGNKLTLKEYSSKWLNEYAIKNLEATTYSNYVQNLNLRIIPALGHIKLSELKPLHLQSFYNNLMEDGVRADKKSGGLSAATIMKTHAVLSSMLKTAVQWQLIESNPCDRVKPPRKKKETKDVKHFTLEQAEAFLRALETDYSTSYRGHKRTHQNGQIYNVCDYIETRKVPLQLQVFFNMAMFGGLRRGELIALTWDDIDFNTNIIKITKSTAYVDKKVITKTPKNESSIREVALPGTVMNLLKEYKKEQRIYQMSIGDQWIGNNYIFIQWNGKQMHPDTPYNAFKKIIKRYNDTITNESDKLPNIPLHGLRHTSATLLISNNVDVRTVSSRLGHSQTSTTMNIYAHALKESDNKAAAALENMFKNA